MSRIKSSALDQLKYEVANEIGVKLDPAYNGNMTTHEAGLVGGNMTRKLVAYAEQQLTNTRIPR